MMEEVIILLDENAKSGTYKTLNNGITYTYKLRLFTTKNIAGYDMYDCTIDWISDNGRHGFMNVVVPGGNEIVLTRGTIRTPPAHYGNRFPKLN